MERSKTVKHFLRKFELQLAIIGVFLALLIFYIMGNPRVFLAYDIYYSFMSTIPFSAIMALSLTLVIICGEMDLSFPSIMGFSGWVFAAVFGVTKSTVLAMLSCLITGIIAGILNGAIVVKIRIPSLIATIGMMFFWRGLVMVCSGGIGKTLVPTKGTILYNTLVSRIGGAVPAQAVWTVVLTIIFWLFLNRHKFGSHVYFTGDNAESARMMGIDVNKVKMFVFIQMGFFAAFAGVLSSLEVLYFWPTLGEGYLLRTIATVFVGGTSVFGGVGTVLGTFIGSLIIGSLEAAIITMGLTGFWTQLIYGLVMVISLSIYSFLRRRS